MSIRLLTSGRFASSFPRWSSVTVDLWLLCRPWLEWREPPTWTTIALPSTPWWAWWNRSRDSSTTRALDILNACARDPLDSRGVHCSVICPYYIDTGMFAGVNPGVLPLLKPRQVVNAVDIMVYWDVDDACDRVWRSLCNMSVVPPIRCLSYPETQRVIRSFTTLCRLLLPYPVVMHCFKVLGVLE